MPLFLLRGGTIRRCSVVPEGIATRTYHDRRGRPVLALLDVASERCLLAAQPPRSARRRAARGSGTLTEAGGSAAVSAA